MRNILEDERQDISDPINFELLNSQNPQKSDSDIINVDQGKTYKSKFEISNTNNNNMSYYIIIADDNHLINSCNQRIIDGLMSELNLFEYEIIMVSDGLDVIKIFLNNEIKDKIKLIITDENMDYFNGSEMIKFIRKVEKLTKLNPINIAFVSSEDDSRHKDFLLACGADFVFTKPLSKKNVRISLEKSIQKNE